MDQDRQPTPKRVKVVDAAAHRTGAKRAAVKPHKRTTASIVKQAITAYTANLKSSSVKQTYWGDTITKNAAALQTNFALAADDEPYLLMDVSGKGQAGMLLSATGVHLADGRGGTYAISWKDFATTSVAYQRGTLVIGQSGITSTDGQAMVTLLQQIKEKLA